MRHLVFFLMCPREKKKDGTRHPLKQRQPQNSLRVLVSIMRSPVIYSLGLEALGLQERFSAPEERYVRSNQVSASQGDPLIPLFLAATHCDAEGEIDTPLLHSR